MLHSHSTRCVHNRATAGHWITATALFALLGVAACSHTVEPAATTEPTYSSIQSTIFNLDCTTSSCHSAFGNAGGLVLTSDAAYTNLVGVTSENDAARSRGLMRVNPGKPDSSFLMIKLNGPGLGEGAQMPNKLGQLSADQIAAVRQWIANGAKRD